MDAKHRHVCRGRETKQNRVSKTETHTNTDCMDTNHLSGTRGRINYAPAPVSLPAPLFPGTTRIMARSNRVTMDRLPEAIHA